MATTTPQWLNCGIYDQPVLNENAVHALEHGAVWITYNPDLSADDVQKLRDLMPSSYIVLSPYPGWTPRWWPAPGASSSSWTGSTTRA